MAPTRLERLEQITRYETRPAEVFTSEPATNRDSTRRLAQLEPKLVCVGHGPSLRDGRRLVDFVEPLP